MTSTNIEDDQFIEFCKGANINYDNLPELKRSEQDVEDGTKIRLEEMTAPIMKHTQILFGGLVSSIVMSVRGISPTKLTLFKGNPEICSIKGTLMIYDYCHAGKSTDTHLRVLSNPDTIRSAYEFVHDNSGHVGKHVDVCPKCEWVNQNVSKSMLTLLLTDKDPLFRIDR